MESINKNMPLISCIIGLGILLFSILHFIGGVRTELKADMAQVKSDLKADVAQVKSELKADVAQVKSDLKVEMASMETRLNTRMDRIEIQLNGRMDHMETTMKSINEKLGLLLQAQRKPASTKKRRRASPKAPAGA